MACTIDKVESENGNPSILYRDLLEVTGDQSRALSLYLSFDSMNFDSPLDENGEPILSEIDEDIISSYLSPYEIDILKDYHYNKSISDTVDRGSKIKGKIRSYLQQAKLNLQKQLNKNTSEERRIVIEEQINEIEEEQSKLSEANKSNVVEEIFSRHIKRIERILSSDRPDTNDLLYAIRLAEMWDYQVTQNFLSERQKRTDSDNKPVDEYNILLRNISSEMTGYYEDLVDKAYDIMTKEIQNTWDVYSDISISEVKRMKDIGYVTANMFNLSNVDEPLIALLRRKIVKANQRNKTHIQKRSQELNSALDNVDDPSFLLARDEDGDLINELIGVFTHKYYSEVDRIQERFFSVLDREDASEEQREKARTRMFRKLNDIQLTIDMNKVLDDEDAYRQELIDIFGKEELVDFAITKAKERYNRYKSRRLEKKREARERLKDEGYEGDDLDKRVSNILKRFDKYNDPKEFVNQSPSEKNYSAYKNTYNIAKDDSFVNDRFYNMSDEQRNLYNVVTDILSETKQYLPDVVSKNVSGETFMPKVKASIISVLKEDGVRAALRTGKNNWYDEVLTDTKELELREDNIETEVNPFTGVGGIVPVKYVKQTDTVEGNAEGTYKDTASYSIGTIVEHNGKYFKSLTNDNNTDTSSDEWREVEPIKYTKDIVAATKAFMYMGLMYKQLNEVSVEAELILKMVEEAETRKGDTVVRDQGPVRIKQRVIDEIKHQIYGDRRDDEYISDHEWFGGFITSGNPIKSYKDIVKKKEIEQERDELYDKLDNGEIEQNEFNTQLEILKERYKELGGRSLIWGNLMDSTLLKFTQIKGMGYNALAAFRNVIFGLHSVFVHAAGNQEFSDSDVTDAFRTILSELAGRKDSNGLNDSKFLSIIKSYDILHTVDEVEFNKDRESAGGGWFIFQNWTEKFAQGISTVAAMKNKDITVVNNETGEEVEISLYEAYDNDANWKDKYSQPDEWKHGTPDREAGEEFTDFQIMIKQLNGNMFGDFASTSTHPFKRHLVGRAVSMFKTYLPEIVKYRFGQVTYDKELKRNKEGIYRSMARNAFEKPAEIGKLLTEIIPFKDRLREENVDISSDDIANIRRAMREIATMMWLYLFGMVLKSMAEEEDDWQSVGVANQIIRINQDIVSYVNPNTAVSIVDDPTAFMGTITQASAVMTSAHRTIFDDEYQGDHPVWKTAKLMPISSQITSFVSQTEEIKE